VFGSGIFVALQCIFEYRYELLAASLLSAGMAGISALVAITMAAEWLKGTSPTTLFSDGASCLATPFVLDSALRQLGWQPDVQGFSFPAFLLWSGFCASMTLGLWIRAAILAVRKQRTNKDD
jgi:hypothetical protein